MAKETTAPPAASETPTETRTATPVQPKRKYRYVGQAYRKGIYLPDATTLIDPATVPDSDLEVYFERFPVLRQQFEEVK